MGAELAPPPARGRPTTFTAEMGDAICGALLEGESLAAICRREDMPSRGTVLRWIAAEPDFRRLYRQARQLAAELMADELLEIIDDSSADHTEDSNGNPKVNAEAIQRSRLRFDGRRYLMSKLLPHLYGDHKPDGPGAPPPGEGAAPAADGMLPAQAARPTLTADQIAAVSRALAARYTLEGTATNEDR